jgi:hypothetical protein
VRQRPSEAIQLPDHQDVALPHEGQGGRRGDA